MVFFLPCYDEHTYVHLSTQETQVISSETEVKISAAAMLEIAQVIFRT